MTLELETQTVSESVPVTLARMEGILNVIVERGKHTDLRVDGVEREVTQLRLDMGEQKSQTQSLKEGADADKKTAVALALALKEADENRRTKTEEKWSPFQKIITGLGGVALVIGLVLPVLNAVKP